MTLSSFINGNIHNNRNATSDIVVFMYIKEVVKSLICNPDDECGMVATI